MFISIAPPFSIGIFLVSLIGSQEWTASSSTLPEDACNLLQTNLALSLRYPQSQDRASHKGDIGKGTSRSAQREDTSTSIFNALTGLEVISESNAVGHLGPGEAFVRCREFNCAVHPLGIMHGDFKVYTRGYSIGEKVERRDKGEKWGPGYVTDLDPLKVTVFEDPDARGYIWDNVRKMPEVKFEDKASNHHADSAGIAAHGEPGSVGLLCKDGRCNIGIIPNKNDVNDDATANDTVDFGSRGASGLEQHSNRIRLDCVTGRCSLGIHSSQNSRAATMNYTGLLDTSIRMIRLHCDDGQCTVRTTPSEVDTGTGYLD